MLSKELQDMIKAYQIDEEVALNHKNVEYTGKSECVSEFSNFETMERIDSLVENRNEIYKSVFTAMVKHLAWWVDHMNGRIYSNRETRREHYKDIHNYLYLQEAMYSMNDNEPQF